MHQDRCTTCGAAVDAAITSPACSAAFTHYNATVRCGSCLAASGTLQASIDSACAAQVNNAYRNSVYLPNAQVRPTAPLYGSEGSIANVSAVMRV